MTHQSEIQWSICRAARSELDAVKDLLGDAYADWLGALKETMCDYFSAHGSCDRKQGASVAPVKSGVQHGKGLKVRFAYPGCGKSGGLRLAVLAFCSERRVKIAGAWRRKDDPDDGNFAQAFQAHSQ